MGSTLSSLGALILVTALCFDMARRTAAGTFSRNHIYGLRVASTLASDRAWDAGHRAALPYLRALGWGGLVVVVVAVGLVSGFAVSGCDLPEAAVAVPLGALCLQVIGMVLATMAANKAAKRVLVE
ncbi:SdpI family protein [Corynebacterium sp. USCH3]|uniref:SdpI family protein n=1 Tax=Corynebacterium sp. USCH3 TaxID=3024840 RepID=UPI003099FBA4